MTETSGRKKVLEGAWNTWRATCPSEVDTRGAFEAGFAALASPSTQEPSGTFATPNLVSEGGFQVRQGILTTQEPALRGGKVEEIIARALCKSDGTGQCAPICLSHFSTNTTDGKCPEAELVWRHKVKAIATALHTSAGESAAQSERAGLERAAAWHEEQAKRSWQGSAKLPDYECHVKSAKAIRALSAARKAGGE